MIDGINDEKKQEIYDFVKALHKDAVDKRDPYDERVRDWARLYNSIPLDDKEDWQHNIFVPYIFSTVETIKPRIIASIFNDPNYTNIDAIDKAYAPHEKKINDWLLMKLRQMDFKSNMNKSIAESLIYPCSWQKVITNQSSGGDITVSTHKADFFDVWVPFEAKEHPDYIFHRIESNLNKIMANANKEFYEIDDVQALSDSTYPLRIPEKKAEIEAYFLGIGDIAVNRKKVSESAKRLQKVEILEWWGYYDVDGTGIDSPIVVSIANREIGLRIDRFEDRIPFFPIRVGKSDTVFYGRPIAQQLEALQEELNEKRSLRADSLERLMTQMFKARRTSSIDWDNLFSAPDNVLLMDDIHDDLDTIDFKGLPSAVYDEENIIKSDMQYTAGAQDYNAMSNVAGGTATGVNAIVTEAATRFRSLVDDVAEDMLDLIEFVFMKLKKNTDTNDAVRNFDTKKWQSVTSEDLKGGYKLDVGISNITTANKEMRMQLLINLLNVVGSTPGLVNIPEYVKKILRYADIKNPELIMADAGNQTGVTRADIVAAKQGRDDTALDPAMTGVENRIVESGQALGKPLAAQAPQAVQDPFLDLIQSMGGGS